MKFDLHQSIIILEKTPALLRLIMQDLNESWYMQNEGKDSWSAYDIVGHFIQGEKTDWIERTKIILDQNSNKTFVPFDRFAQFKNSKGKSLNTLLDEFKQLRIQNLEELKSFELEDSDFDKVGVHPEFGEVTLRQLLSTWTVHDLNHLNQIFRVMLKQYKDQMGPWVNYFSLLK